MFLVRLIYASHVANGFDEESIEDILGAARKNNPKKGVTGLLCFSSDYFLQCLEGSRSAVNEIYNCILNDDRHDGSTIVDYREIVERDFAHWSMGYVVNSASNRDINLHFSRDEIFNPFQMSGESCHRMLVQLSKTVPVV